MLDLVELPDSSVWILLVNDSKPLVVTALPEDVAVAVGDTVDVIGVLASYDEERGCGPRFIEIDALRVLEPSN